MLRLLAALSSFWLFGASILLTKGMSLVTIPLVTGRLAPSDYGRLELVTSMVEAFGIVMTLGLADSLFRFAGPETGVHRREIAAGLTGMALTLAVAVGALLQVGVWTLAPRLGLAFIQTPLAIGMAAATLAGLIELPLAWLRLRGRAGAFLGFTVARTMLQVATMAVTLNLGFGVIGLLAGNASIDALLATTLLTLQIRECGVRLDRATFERAGRYSAPLIGGSLSMFVLGSCDRWFLAGAVPTATLGFYGLAVKLSLITPLVIQPFGLWWYARRIAVLRQPGGLETSARGVAIGMTLLAAGAVASCVGAPLLVQTLLPHAYRAALPFLPWLVLASVLNESCSLVNVGAYAGHHGLSRPRGERGGSGRRPGRAMSRSPSPIGVWGAIAATLAGHVARLALYLASGRRDAPIRYPWGLAAALAGARRASWSPASRLAPDVVIAARHDFAGPRSFRRHRLACRRTRAPARCSGASLHDRRDGFGRASGSAEQPHRPGARDFRAGDGGGVRALAARQSQPLAPIGVALLPFAGLIAFSNPFALCLAFVDLLLLPHSRSLPGARTPAHPANARGPDARGSVLARDGEAQHRALLEPVADRSSRSSSRSVTLGLPFAVSKPDAIGFYTANYWKVAVMTLAIAWLTRRPRDFAIASHAFVFAGVLIAGVAIYNRTLRHRPRRGNARHDRPRHPVAARRSQRPVARAAVPAELRGVALRRAGRAG